MLSYRLECLQADGSWSAHEFQSADDDDAIIYGLSERTARRCELYQAGRWLATFDGPAELRRTPNCAANENTITSFVVEVC